MKYVPPSSQEEKIFAAHIADLAKLSERRETAEFSAFLNLRERELALQAAARFSVETTLFGGYPEAERVVLRTAPLGTKPGGFPIRALDFASSVPVTHRDVLGSILALGISRDPIGDILVSRDGFRVFVMEGIADFIASGLKKAGKASVRYSPGTDMGGKATIEENSGTVSSPRLDGVVAELAGCSRGSAEELITSGRVSVNHMTVEKPSYTVETGDVISVRGKGKFKVEDMGGISRKGRVIIKYGRYV